MIMVKLRGPAWNTIRSMFPNVRSAYTGTPFPEGGIALGSQSEGTSEVLFVGKPDLLVEDGAELAHVHHRRSRQDEHHDLSVGEF
jgi:hypothetical protein